MTLTPPNGLDREDIDTPVMPDPRDGNYEAITTTPPPSGLDPKVLDMEKRLLELNKAAKTYNPELIVCDEKNKEVVRAITTMEVKVPQDLVMIKEGIVLCPFPGWNVEDESLQMRIFTLNVNDELNSYDQVKVGLLGLAHWPNTCRKTRTDEDKDNNETFYAEMVNLTKALTSYYFDLLVGTEKERLTTTIDFEKAAESIDRASFIPGPLPKKPEQINLDRGKVVIVDWMRMPQIKAAIQKYFLTRHEETLKRASRKNSLAALRIHADLAMIDPIGRVTSDIRNLLGEGRPLRSPTPVGKFRK
ncbi:hypothetical protein IT411_00625 [Candidatus Peregrinibacteria bacterium]|nr:hypothetical protein [Candidatus Peregrinibacteria bacterium]